MCMCMCMYVCVCDMCDDDERTTLQNLKQKETDAVKDERTMMEGIIYSIYDGRNESLPEVWRVSTVKYKTSNESILASSSSTIHPSIHASALRLKKSPYGPSTAFISYALRVPSPFLPASTLAEHPGPPSLMQQAYAEPVQV